MAAGVVLGARTDDADGLAALAERRAELGQSGLLDRDIKAVLPRRVTIEKGIQGRAADFDCRQGFVVDHNLHKRLLRRRRYQMQFGCSEAQPHSTLPRTPAVDSAKPVFSQPSSPANSVGGGATAARTGPFTAAAPNSALNQSRLRIYTPPDGSARDIFAFCAVLYGRPLDWCGARLQSPVWKFRRQEAGVVAVAWEKTRVIWL
jgi:hypothetical protein